MESDDPHRELGTNAIARDAIAGATLIALGLATGTSSFVGRADGIDYAFDALGLFWILWAIARVARGRWSRPREIAK